METSPPLSKNSTTMNTLAQSSGVSVRDPIAAAIADYLHREVAQGRAEFEMAHEGERVRVSFDNVTAHGETDEIALVRLARLLLDDSQYFVPLSEVLRTQMPADDGDWHERPGSY
jgi:hypothetical protein